MTKKFPQKMEEKNENKLEIITVTPNCNYNIDIMPTTIEAYSGMHKGTEGKQVS